MFHNAVYAYYTCIFCKYVLEESPEEYLSFALMRLPSMNRVSSLLSLIHGLWADSQIEQWMNLWNFKLSQFEITKLSQINSIKIHNLSTPQTTIAQDEWKIRHFDIKNVNKMFSGLVVLEK